MAQSGYTPILIYASGTTGNAPVAANLTSSSSGAELALNYFDGKLFYKDASGNVQVLAVKMPSGILPIANGGTNATATPTAGAVAYGTGTAYAFTSAGTPGYLLTSNGSSAPLWISTLPVANGGTNATATPTAGAVAYGTGTAYAFTAAGTSNQVLVSNGASAPTWSNLSSIGVTTFSAGTTGFTPSSATAGAVTLAGTLATTNGGTGLTSFTANGVVYASSSSALTTGSALTFDGTNFGVGTSSYGNAGTINAAVGVPGTTTGGLQLWSTTTTSHYVQFGDGTTGDGPYRGAVGYNHSLDALVLYAAGAEKASLTSTGLGVGQSSPAYKLDVKASSAFNVARFAGQASSVSTYIYTDTAYWAFGDGTSYTGQLYGGHAINKTLSMYTDSVERVIIGATGTLTIVSGGLNLGSGGANGYISGGTWYGISNGDWNFQAGNASQNFVWKNSSGSNLARITSAGELVVGATNTGVGKLVSYYNSTAANPLDPQYAGLNVWGSVSVRLLVGTDLSSPYAAYIQASNTGTGFPIALNPSGGDVTIGSLSVYNGGGFGKVLGIYNSSSAATSYANASRQYQTGINSASQFGIYDANAAAYRLLVATDGSVGIGEPSPSIRLQVAGPMNVAAANFKSVISASSTDSQAANTGAGITLGGVFTGSSQTAFAQIAGIKENSTSGNYAGVLAFYSRPNGDTLYERARITSTGQFVVGGNSEIFNNGRFTSVGGPYPVISYGSDTGYTQGAFISASGTDSSPGGRGQGMYLWNQGNNTTWYMGTLYGGADTWCLTRRAVSGFQDSAAQGTYALLTVNSSGDLIVGNLTTSDGRLTVKSAAASIALSILNSSGTRRAICLPDATYGYIWAGSVPSNGTTFWRFEDAGAGYAGGIIINSGSVNYSSASDIRLKNDLGVATSTDVIKNTVIHDFEWKSSGEKSKGVFAQEAILVKPSAVTQGHSDELNENGSPKYPWGVDYSKYIPDIIVELQSLRAEFEAYKASHP